MARTSKAQEALEFAKQMAEQSADWIAFHNALFGIGGKISVLFPPGEEKVEFVKSPEYKQITEMMGEMQSALGAVPEANGKILLRLPKSIHSALLVEAEGEGVSLNQLCLAKLSCQLKAVTL